MFLVDVKNFEEWRSHARPMLQRKIFPENISWKKPQQDTLFVDDSDNISDYPLINKDVTIPREFFSLARDAACFRDDNKWPVLYRMAWRLMYEDRRLIFSPTDSDMRQLKMMRKQVARDKHKMEAFLRFRKVDNSVLKTVRNQVDDELKMPTQHGNLHGGDVEYFIAWFEPDHLIIPAVAPFFKKRFHNMMWSIFTPDVCVHWDRQHLHFSSGVVKAPEVNDELESLWLTYYRHIFNPARLKLKAMQSEMPKKYWHNLPEANLIKELTQSSYHDVEKMIEQAGADGDNVKMRNSRYVKASQEKLRRSRHGDRDATSASP